MLTRISTYLNALEEACIMFSLVIMGVVLSLQVFCRYALNQPLVWSEELARYLFVWVTFIGASYGMRHRIHISMELLFVRLPVWAKLLTHCFTNLVAMAVFIMLIPPGLEFTMEQHDILSSAMQVPMSWVYLAVPVGCCLVTLRLLADTISNLKTGGRKL